MSDGFAIELRGVRKEWDEVVAVQKFDVGIRKGEFFSLLGPSGCGKTTTLRMIAGLEEPTEGEILLEGRDVSRVPPYRRNVHTVFQDYALFPHMTVRKNIWFPLKMKGVSFADAKERIERVLKVVSMEGYDRRLPQQLSGGQRQRVAPPGRAAGRPGLQAPRGDAEGAEGHPAQCRHHVHLRHP